ncbi:MAG TPA: GNA1162 family protein [Nitrospirota bacterium]|nr:GNA1162 family protein [Nitrospirota bacterium]
MIKRMLLVGLLGMLVLIAGCSIPRPPLPSNPSNPLKHVAVLPLKNDTNDVEGPDVVRLKMVEALENRSYVVKDLKETDQILRDQMGITLGGQLDLTTAQKLGEALGVQGVLYGTLMDFDEMTTGVINVKKVRGKFRLVNTATDEVMWARGLGVRSEVKMEGVGGSAAAALTRAADARDKDVPWVTIASQTSDNSSVQKSFVQGLGSKLISKAIGKHLDYESTELARRITTDLPWGPGTAIAGAAPQAPGMVVAPVMPKFKMPEPPSFGYMDWEGKRDFSAVIYSTRVDKSRDETFTMEMPLAIAGNKVRMDMDLSKMSKGNPRNAQSPIGKMVMINRGDKKTSYTLYPNAQKYIVHTPQDVVHEKPRIEKTKIGTEMINNYLTDKFRVKVFYKEGLVDEGFIWNARELDGMTIKSEVEGKNYRVTTELKNIILKRPPNTLFEIPEGYIEAQSYMDLMAAQPNK